MKQMHGIGIQRGERNFVEVQAGLDERQAVVRAVTLSRLAAFERQWRAYTRLRRIFGKDAAAMARHLTGARLSRRIEPAPIHWSRCSPVQFDSSPRRLQWIDRDDNPAGGRG